MIKNYVNRKITSYIYLWIFTKSIWLQVKHFIALTKRESVRRIYFWSYRPYPCQQIDQWPRKTRESTSALENNENKAYVRIKRVKSDRYLPTANHVKHEIIPPHPEKNWNKHMFYENVTWDGYIKKKLGRYTNCIQCIAVVLILKHNQNGSRLVWVRYIIYSTKLKPTLWRHMKMCHSRVHYMGKF